MKQEPEIPKDLFVSHGKEIEEVFARAVRRALLRHKRLGNPIATWRDGRVVIIPPEEIPVEDEPHSQLSGHRKRDIEIINQNAEGLNEEAIDVLSYQVDLWSSEEEVKDEV